LLPSLLEASAIPLASLAPPSTTEGPPSAPSLVDDGDDEQAVTARVIAIANPLRLTTGKEGLMGRHTYQPAEHSLPE
jgi:hypothetical protein